MAPSGNAWAQRRELEKMQAQTSAEFSKATSATHEKDETKDNDDPSGPKPRPALEIQPELAASSPQRRQLAYYPVIPLIPPGSSLPYRGPKAKVETMPKAAEKPSGTIAENDRVANAKPLMEPTLKNKRSKLSGLRAVFSGKEKQVVPDATEKDTAAFQRPSSSSNSMEESVAPKKAVRNTKSKSSLRFRRNKRGSVLAESAPSTSSFAPTELQNALEDIKRGLDSTAAPRSAPILTAEGDQLVHLSGSSSPHITVTPAEPNDIGQLDAAQFRMESARFAETDGQFRNQIGSDERIRAGSYVGALKPTTVSNHKTPNSVEAAVEDQRKEETYNDHIIVRLPTEAFEPSPMALTAWQDDQALHQWDSYRTSLPSNFSSQFDQGFYTPHSTHSRADSQNSLLVRDNSADIPGLYEGSGRIVSGLCIVTGVPNAEALKRHSDSLSEIQRRRDELEEVQQKRLALIERQATYKKLTGSPSTVDTAILQPSGKSNHRLDQYESPYESSYDDQSYYTDPNFQNYHHPYSYYPHSYYPHSYYSQDYHPYENYEDPQAFEQQQYYSGSIATPYSHSVQSPEMSFHQFLEPTTPVEVNPGDGQLTTYVPTPPHPDFVPSASPLDPSLRMAFTALHLQLENLQQKSHNDALDVKDAIMDKTHRLIEPIKENLDLNSKQFKELCRRLVTLEAAIAAQLEEKLQPYDESHARLQEQLNKINTHMSWMTDKIRRLNCKVNKQLGLDEDTDADWVVDDSVNPPNHGNGSGSGGADGQQRGAQNQKGHNKGGDKSKTSQASGATGSKGPEASVDVCVQPAAAPGANKRQVSATADAAQVAPVAHQVGGSNAEGTKRARLAARVTKAPESGSDSNQASSGSTTTAPGRTGAGTERRNSGDAAFAMLAALSRNPNSAHYQAPASPSTNPAGHNSIWRDGGSPVPHHPAREQGMAAYTNAPRFLGLHPAFRNSSSWQQRHAELMDIRARQSGGGGAATNQFVPGQFSSSGNAFRQNGLPAFENRAGTGLGAGAGAGAGAGGFMNQELAIPMPRFRGLVAPHRFRSQMAMETQTQAQAAETQHQTSSYSGNPNYAAAAATTAATTGGNNNSANPGSNLNANSNTQPGAATSPGFQRFLQNVTSPNSRTSGSNGNGRNRGGYGGNGGVAGRRAATITRAATKRASAGKGNPNVSDSIVLVGAGRRRRDGGGNQRGDMKG